MDPFRFSPVDRACRRLPDAAECARIEGVAGRGSLTFSEQSQRFGSWEGQDGSRPISARQPAVSPRENEDRRKTMKAVERHKPGSEVLIACFPRSGRPPVSAWQLGGQGCESPPVIPLERGGAIEDWRKQPCPQATSSIRTPPGRSIGWQPMFGRPTGECALLKWRVE